ncbi:hypothetical protein TVAG_388810 [Trichomonas vaginalis G3]|uniref:Uncharacterized protein n=1 Tax=Trichomonas vaginalis (strain ATCC PRA-98 / G3) TaxID=412133 RepID=A2DYL3_TRIV3|nr:hypothetical protein TVAGG3_0320800 [Trichomonas vaginalis G3]EAY14548.1 hypothetical protein TVAG_388810 [Trichomonas vaginalis G3]KAI5529284.1 hypothetical protein TVAGG3_0320800 [Trichomonas vaginalis G3]|eukprot:XP_001326771.1 hypothetical protein [Trichomonas vaginalis G3]
MGSGGSDIAGGTAFTNRGATNGSLFYGGAGSNMLYAYGGGGGGSGYYGGGGGSSTENHNYGYCGSGGGGSGYIGGVWSSEKFGVTAETKSSTNDGNGYLKITYYGRFPLYNICKTIICASMFHSYAFILLFSVVIMNKD